MNESTDTTVYRPNQRHEMGLLKTWAIMAADVYRSRELIRQLFKRSFLGSYKKSFLGVTWIFIMPLTGIISWIFLKQTGMLKPGDVGIPYPAYVLIGTSMWGLFMGFFRASGNTLGAGRALIMQVRYCHEALLFQQVAQELANFTIGFIFNIIVLIVFRVVPSWGIVLLPVVALPLFFLGAAVGLIVSMISIVAVDVRRFIDLAMAFLMYLTPVIYSDKAVSPLVLTINKWNPLTYLVCSCRDIIIYGRLYEPRGYAIAAILSFLGFMISWRLFYVSEHNIVEKMV